MPKPRTCKKKGCETILNQYNKNKYCLAHSLDWVEKMDREFYVKMKKQNRVQRAEYKAKREAKNAKKKNKMSL
jgi:hypothetical protein